MGIISKVIHKQARLLLENDRYAYLITALMAVLPFVSWIAVTIVAFITLRKGARLGFNTMLCGLVAFLLTTFPPTSITGATLVVVLLTFVPCYLAAILLRVTTSWSWAMLFLLSLTTAIVLLLNISTPEFLIAQYHALQDMLKELQLHDVQLLGFLGTPTQIMAYLLGIQAMTFTISIVGTLILARAIQSQLFYPEGFKKEMLSFKVQAFMLPPFLLILYGLYQHAPVAISLLPTWLLYFVCAGLSVIVAQFSNNKPILIFTLLLIPMILLPLVVLPIIAGIGIIDVFFHFNRRLEKQNAHHS